MPGGCFGLGNSILREELEASLLGTFNISLDKAPHYVQ